MTDILDGYGIFGDSTCLEYLKQLNPDARSVGKMDSHFSYHSYSNFWECPLRYFWIFVDKRLPPRPPDKRGTLEGGAMHLAVEHFIEERPGDIANWCQHYARMYFDQYLLEIKKGFKWKSQTDSSDAYDKYLGLLARACSYVKLHVFDDPMVKQIFVERPFVVRILPDITVGGRVDLIMVKQANPEAPQFLDIVDWKGTTRQGTVSREQLMFYGIGGMAVAQIPVRLVSFAFPGLNKESLFKFNDSEYEGFIFKLRSISENIKQNRRIPTTRRKNCRWCVYAEVCEDKPLD